MGEILVLYGNNEDYYKPIKTKDAFVCYYLQLESINDRKKDLSVEEYPEEFNAHLLNLHYLTVTKLSIPLKGVDKKVMEFLLS